MRYINIRIDRIFYFFMANFVVISFPGLSSPGRVLPANQVSFYPLAVAILSFVLLVCKYG